MFIDRHAISYKPGDSVFRGDDKLMTTEEFLAWLAGPEQVSIVAATGASIWNIIFQGEDAEAGVFLGVQGDPVSDWLNLYTLTDKDVERWNDAKSKSWGGKKLESGTCLNLMNDAYDMLEIDLSPSLATRLELPDPTLTKCMFAGMCAMLDNNSLAIMTLLPGAAQRIVAKVMQLR